MTKINVIKNHEFKSGTLNRSDYSGNFEFITYYINLKANNFGEKPARRIFKEYDIIKEIYAVDGVLHRMNDPAEIIYRDCRISRKRYYEFGVFVREKKYKMASSKQVLFKRCYL